MLIVGLYIYYGAESEQSNGVPIMEEAYTVDAMFQGFSALKSGGKGQQFVWYLIDGAVKGSRLTPEQLFTLRESDPPLVDGDTVTLELAPRVSESKTMWLIQIERDGLKLLE